jgi:preprotein translocase subunit YajC
MNEFEIGDVVNDTAGNAGEVIELKGDYYVKVEWEDGSTTVEMKTKIIWVSH